MMDFLNSFKSLIKLEKIHTDNNIFKMHYKFTVIMLIVFSILLTSKQYFGDPIDCEVEGSTKSVVDTYCWIYGTYIVKKTLKDDLMPGLGHHPDSKLYYNRKQAPMPEIFEPQTPYDDVISQKYYQWVCIVFIFQALLFYIPRYLWKTWEGGRLRILIKDLGGPLIPQSWNRESKERLITYMICGKYPHNMYAIRYAFCELLNFLNVICQIILMNWFLTGHFTGYGIGVATFQGNDNPMKAVFPKLTKCTYYKYGPGGSPQSRDALCVLPLNVVNEKLFLFLWFWLVFLTIMSFLELIYRIMVLTLPIVRVYILMAQAQFLPHKIAYTVVRKLSFGDFFLLHLLGKNLNPLVYKDLVIGIEQAILELGKDLQYSPGFKPEVTMSLKKPKCDV